MIKFSKRNSKIKKEQPKSLIKFINLDSKTLINGLNLKLKNSLLNIHESTKIKHLKNKLEKKIITYREKMQGNITLIHPKSLLQYLQDKLEKNLTPDNDQVILKQAGYWAKAITWVLIGGTSFCLVWVSVAETEEIVIAVGKLEPKGGVIDVQMPIEGISKEILVKEGDSVKKGDVLIRLDTDITKAKNYSLNKSLEINNDIKNRLSYLISEGAVSELQYMQQIERIEDIKSQIKANLVQLKYQEILSPADGTIFELEPKGPGYVARTSQPVLKIVPSNNLIAKVEINSRQIGFVDEGKAVEISIDSFPASDFGVIEGVVESIGSDALPPDRSQGKGYRFPTNITLKDQFLKIKNGKKLKLQAGMSLTANIKLRKVTYIQLLLNKFGDKSKSLKSI